MFKNDLDLLLEFDNYDDLIKHYIEKSGVYDDNFPFEVLLTLDIENNPFSMMKFIAAYVEESSSHDKIGLKFEETPELVNFAKFEESCKHLSGDLSIIKEYPKDEIFKIQQERNEELCAEPAELIKPFVDNFYISNDPEKPEGDHIYLNNLNKSEIKLLYSSFFKRHCSKELFEYTTHKRLPVYALSVPLINKKESSVGLSTFIKGSVSLTLIDSSTNTAIYITHETRSEKYLLTMKYIINVLEQRGDQLDIYDMYLNLHNLNLNFNLRVDIRISKINSLSIYRRYFLKTEYNSMLDEMNKTYRKWFLDTLSKNKNISFITRDQMQDHVRTYGIFDFENYKEYILRSEHDKQIGDYFSSEFKVRKEHEPKFVCNEDESTISVEGYSLDEISKDENSENFNDDIYVNRMTLGLHQMKRVSRELKLESVQDYIKHEKEGIDSIWFDDIKIKNTNMILRF